VIDFDSLQFMLEMVTHQYMELRNLRDELERKDNLLKIYQEGNLKLQDKLKEKEVCPKCKT